MFLMPILRRCLACVVLLAPPQSGGAATAPDQDRPQFLDGTAKIHVAPPSPPSSDTMGKLLVAAPIHVLATEGPWAHVSMSGWTQAGAERILYAAPPGIRVLRGALSKSATETLIFSDSVEDPDTGITWTRTELRGGWIKAPPVMQPSLEDLWARAEPLFSERCTACHQRRVPEHYSANQWASHLKVMGPRTGGLPKEDQFLIRVFLQHHAKDSDRLRETR